MSTSSEIQQRAQQHLQSEYRRLERCATAIDNEESFPDQLLDTVTQLFANVRAGAVWLQSGDTSPPRLASHREFEPLWSDESSEIASQHRSIAARILQTGQAAVLPAKGHELAVGEGQNPFPYHLVCAPAGAENRVVGIVELFVDSELEPSDLRGNVRALLQFSGLLGRWFTAESNRRAVQRETFLSRLVSFSKEIHSGIDLTETCYAIANETRLLLDCNRVSVLTHEHGRCELRAVSGQSTVEPRSRIAKSLTELAHAVIQSEEPLEYTGQSLELPPQIEMPLEHYLDESFAKEVSVFPLSRASSRDDKFNESSPTFLNRSELHQEPLGALVIEQLENKSTSDEQSPLIHPLLDHICSALANSVDHHRIPFLTQISWAQRQFAKHRLPKLAWVTGLLLATLICLTFCPTDFEIRASGVLQPVERRDVFADLDGVVRQVHVKSGDLVASGELLVTIANTDLEVRIVETLGDLQSAQEQALAAEKKMLGGAKLTLVERHQLSQERELLVKKIDALTRQLHLLQEQQELLSVRSNIEGSVITWELEKNLINRPVTRGEVLLTLADLEDEWEVDLFVPERRLGHLVRAQNGQEEPLEVEFMSKANPGLKTVGKTKPLRGSAELDESKGLGLRVSVEFEKQSQDTLYPGAEVTAKIHCGRRAIGYVWFHQMAEWIYEHLIF